MSGNPASLLCAAQSPSRELDRAIANFLGWKLEPNIAWVEPEGTRHGGLPEWTASIDDALALIPKGKPWLLKSASQRRGFRAVVFNEMQFGNVIGDGDSASASLAVCIAALRARENSP